MDHGFHLFAEIEPFEKASAPSGKHRRIGGIVSTDSLDRQSEVVIQTGLDFNPFIQNGWFNDNHGKRMSDVIGYPEAVQFVRKGDTLPNGKQAETNGHWVEGYMLNTGRANEVWDLANNLKDTGRSLGFSIEGKARRRSGKGGSVIKAAEVKHVAVTHVPVNTDTELEILAKSLSMTGGPQSPDPASPPRGVAITGEGAGKLLSPESLDSGLTDLTYGGSRKKRKKRKKSSSRRGLTKGEALEYLSARLPNLTVSQAMRLLECSRRSK